MRIEDAKPTYMDRLKVGLSTPGRQETETETEIGNW
jgi:hypothetical protein